MKDLATIAAQLKADEPALTSCLDFGPFVAQGTGQGRSVMIGEQSEISLHQPSAINSLEHRMAHLAQAGDVVLVRNRDLDFEAYLQSHLGIGAIEFLRVDAPGDMPLTKHAWKSPHLVARLVEATTRGDGLTIKSYLTTGNTWLLAKAIGEAANCMVHVCGPSPRIARRVNDKLWFSRLARDVIGNDATPPTLSAYGPAATAGLVSRISKSAAQVIVKVPDSAGSAGNIKLHSASICDKTITELRRLLLNRLHATGWRERYPVLVGVWDDNVLCSPSVQLWIPHVSDGTPISDGVFEQRVIREEAAFVGAARSTLPEKVQHQLVSEAMQIAIVLQQIGYYGRCSFDAVVCRSPQDGDVIHWIECNGRWGGVSIPMTLAKSLSGVQTSGLLVVQETFQDIRLSTSQLLDLLDDLLLQPDRCDEGIILLSPALSDAGTSANMLVLTKSQESAEETMTRAMSRIRPAA